MKRTDENHSFNIHIATALKGHVKKAILLKEIYGWVYLNGLKEKNVKHGIVWTYMSADSFAEKFPYMNYKSIAQWLRELEKAGWLFSSRFNKKAYDKTKWYTINSKMYDDTILGNLHSITALQSWIAEIQQSIATLQQSSAKIKQPIPTPKQLLKKDNNNSIGKIKDLERELKEVKDLLSKKEEKPKTKRKIFIAPTLEAVKGLFAEKGSTNQEAENFYYHYESNGWKVGKNKMQKWRASAGGWIGRNKKSTPQPQQKDLAASYKQHLTYYLNEKQRKSLNGQIEAYIAKCKENDTQSEIDTFRSQMPVVKNKTFTDALVFDVIYGTLKKCGTIPERRFSKFRQWYNKLSNYNQNQTDLRKAFRKHLSQ